MLNKNKRKINVKAQDRANPLMIFKQTSNVYFFGFV